MRLVAMHGNQMPISYYYEAAIMLASALLAILFVSTALLLLHFRERTPATLLAAGALVGCGILAMHLVGMAGLPLYRAAYLPLGTVLAVASAIGLCIVAFWVAYGRRTNRSILLGTLCFGVAASAVHFVAFVGTRFVPIPTLYEFAPVMSNETFAMGVIISGFAIFDEFLWVGVTLFVSAAPTPQPQDAPAVTEKSAPKPDAPKPAPVVVRIPCERNGGTQLIDPAQVAFVRAEGHYTNVYTKNAKHFCVWPISEAVTRLNAAGFIKTHRSYLVNPTQVKHFERLKDNGVCRFAAANLPPVPVSRSNLKLVRDTLGL